MDTQPTPDGPVMVYIAGPYTNPDPVVNTREALDEADFLLDELGLERVTPIVPHLTMFWHFNMPRDVDFWYQYDLAVLERCDVLYRIPGESTGADNEVKFAEGHGIPVWRDAESLVHYIAEYGRDIKQLTGLGF